MAKLLVVDDDPEIHEVLQEVFWKDYEVLRAYDTRKAKELIEDFSPEVVLVDMQLRDETGDSLVRENDC